MDVKSATFLGATGTSGSHVPRFAIGRRLRPYAIGHQIALKATGNRFVADLDLPQELRPVPTFEDLIEAAFVCSRSFEEGQAELYSRWMPLRMWHWGRRAGRFDVVAEIIALQRWIAGANEFPDVNRRVGDEATCETPWENRLRLRLLQEGIAKSGSEAWNYPLRLAHVDLLTLAEMKGDGRLSFFSERDAELMRVAKSLEEERTE